MQAGVKAVPGIIEKLKAKYDRERLIDAVKLLIKLLENIENNPVEEKFRSVKKTNATLQSKLFCFSGIEQIFRELGFVEDDEFFRFTSQSIQPISQALIFLRAEEVQLQNHAPQTEEAKKRIAEIDAGYRRKEEEKQKLMEQMKRDRMDKKADLEAHPIQDSKANKLAFGAKMITSKDLNPDMDKQGG
jgi:hypothetical protein